jgi:hypothetical protein
MRARLLYVRPKCCFFNCSAGLTIFGLKAAIVTQGPNEASKAEQDGSSHFSQSLAHVYGQPNNAIAAFGKSCLSEGAAISAGLPQLSHQLDIVEFHALGDEGRKAPGLVLR